VSLFASSFATRASLTKQSSKVSLLGIKWS
jgi:hypothetical protein